MAIGPHTMMITQSAAQSLGVLFLDYLMYTTTSAAVNACFIDDRDPRITYTPSWWRFGSEPDFQHTSQGSTSAGDKFSFEFEGELYLEHPSLFTEVVDSDPPVIFIPDFQPASVTTNNLIFKSKDLSAGSPTLVVTAENNNTVWIDYLLVVPHSPAASNTVAVQGGRCYGIRD
ncbi:hypothetical protein C8J57DRAFT_1506032 [Mycena rebaudengoi]|nr:hypothetical protein C8J57DRAFT_1506032 [Mycena rebaudengoi]